MPRHICSYKATRAIGFGKHLIWVCTSCGHRDNGGRK